ncbi:hypothetical protein [Dyella caseinilytica]|uniref:Uncharacterized protein n=1 Tax=Dyella caseinilytica TaxID=1849581 RepID=A0ABX7H0G9_9GAMM|nr:hypothetical protein [Dyella caseinilytica]QRN55392.1 hypothetical protein ISN74_08750 [Dyella caseinilytica]GGA01367.1 hypothetical protein GCM10011408_23320 [Dyella caseinilytica]
MNMKPENAAITPANANPMKGSEHGLWIGEHDVLTIAIDQQSKKFPPTIDHCSQLNKMIQGLAIAAKAVIYRAENDSSIDTSFAMLPIGDIADSIIILSQLSEAVALETNA